MNFTKRQIEFQRPKWIYLFVIFELWRWVKSIFQRGSK